jgi:hypothetical protein
MERDSKICMKILSYRRNCYSALIQCFGGNQWYSFGTRWNGYSTMILSYEFHFVYQRTKLVVTVELKQESIAL